MVEIKILILEDLNEEEMEDLLLELRYRLKCANGVGVFEIEHERR